MQIDIITPVECRVGKFDAQRLKPILSFKKVYYRPTKKGRVKYTYMKQVWSGKDNKYWYFWRGHLPRVLKYLHKHKVPVKVTRSFDRLITTSPPHLTGITFRPDQLELIDKALTAQFGVILSPTGSGKTIIQLGIASCFKKQRILFLAHTIDLVDQTAEELVKYGFGTIGNEIQILSGAHKTTYNDFTGRIVLSTMQSMSRRDYEEYATYFDIVIVDECHRVSSVEDGQYSHILGNCWAQMRLGFTATLPTDLEAQMALEGYIGPVIGELTRQEAVDKNIIAKPKIRLIKIETPIKLRSEKNYLKAYRKGIVDNVPRNRFIVNLVREIFDEKISLIMVHHIEHGKQIQALGKLQGMSLPFVHGKTKKEERMRVKKALEAGKIRAAIATTVWKEGVNIPSLDVIVNAAGGKDELPVLQAIGRGFRRTDKKSEVEIIDFIDNSNYFFLDHLTSRLQLYSKEGWL